MTDLHPLTEKILNFFEDDRSPAYDEKLDDIVREHLAPPTYVATGSGPRFADHPNIMTEVAGTFIESGNQMQMVLIGHEPVIVVQPEYDADENKITLVLTTVDLPPQGLVEVLEALLDATREIAAQQQELEVELPDPDGSNQLPIPSEFTDLGTSDDGIF